MIEPFHRLRHHEVRPEAFQFFVIRKELLFTALEMNKVHCGDTVLSNAQPFLTGIAVLVDLDRFLQSQILPDYLLRGIGVRHDKPSIGVGECWDLRLS